MSSLNKYYNPPIRSEWKGRISNIASPNEYWHECIHLHLDGLSNLKSEFFNSDIGLLGYASDEGVKRNKGRRGAVNGPKEIRKQLGKLSAHFSGKKITDYGTVISHQGNMEVAQRVYSGIINEIIKSGQLSIGIGGGHDLAYGHFCGIHKAIKNSKIGIINFDAHFDLRPPIENSNSGTPFYQILNEFKNDVRYLAVGIQKFSNPNSLYKIASDIKANYISNEDCTLINLNHIYKVIDEYFKDYKHLYVSIDLDGFASSHAPGVSAPGPFGFSTHFFRCVFEYILKTKKVVAIDIVELNPDYDVDSITAKLAAQIVDIAVTK